MAHPQMPTTIPSPADRGGYRFMAVDADGRIWRWDDEEMVWVATAASCSQNGREEDS